VKGDAVSLFGDLEHESAPGSWDSRNGMRAGTENYEQMRLPGVLGKIATYLLVASLSYWADHQMDQLFAIGLDNKPGIGTPNIAALP
jgi:hypothetical protein